ncbi:tetratricopeptide (TPR) repeat protein [Deinobacterium chartae]|uniref:Tetratricopeptide (TPR) repeat protein n=1 Tax=Deinobacterium chartae TaxID=521158 RepID=A0A841HVJ5_9DEIO|nr:tetratricopeptide repeat protein [Deinobacterium chartae]MBB6097407.1 tetratricopeptide (TPR) repeat protein [Deinobacterium chartae]
MQLLTFAGLALEGSDFKRVKPLLLLAYLALEGQKPRRFVADLMWPEAQDTMNSLAAALTQLRRGAPDTVAADEHRVWANVSCDAVQFLEALRSRRLEEAVSLYRGAFLEGVESKAGPEFEEWVFQTREMLAARAVDALLQLAESEAALGRFAAAAARAERALSISSDHEPETLLRLDVLLTAGRSAVAQQVRAELESYGTVSHLTAEEAQNRLQRVFLGRESERQAIQSAAAHSVIWVRGASGMGKTALLKAVGGTYLQARSGLPYASLEPLAGELIHEGAARILQHLVRSAGASQLWLFDDWERVDPESRELLSQLCALRPAARIVIAARGIPTLEVDRVIELAPLSEHDLRSYPGVWQRTGGLPSLVVAALNDQPLDAALEVRLHNLSESARELYFALALLEMPDAALARRALEFSADTLARALEELYAAALLEPSREVRARDAAIGYLDARPTLREPLALRLARVASGLEAYRLLERTSGAWDETDLPAVRAAYMAWAQELLGRGFPQRAVEVLRAAPTRSEVDALLARALERAGRYRESLEVLERLGNVPEFLALRASVLHRLGRRAEAKAAAELALEGDTPSRAEALGTLGLLLVAQQDYEQAVSHFRKAAALWLMVGDSVKHVLALNNLATARCLMGEGADDAFHEVLEAAGDNQAIRARVLLNLGLSIEQQGRQDEAYSTYLLADRAAAESGMTATSSRIWNNIGALCQRQGRLDEAKAAYKRALEYARQAGEQYMLATTLANLAELTNDVDAWEESLRLFEISGHEAMQAYARSQLPPNHRFRDISGSVT